MAVDRDPHAHTAGDTEPSYSVSERGSFFKREALLATLIVIEAPVLGGLVTSLTADAPLAVQLCLAAAAALAALLMAAARRAVTPVARPRLEPGVPLVPAPAANDEDDL